METPVCPHCIRPLEPGARYCAYCGGAVGIAETAAYPIPIPNSARFDEKHAAAEPAPRARWVRAVGAFWGVWFLISFALIVLAGIVLLITGVEATAGAVFDFGFPAMILGAVCAAVYAAVRSRPGVRPSPPSSSPR